MYAYASLLSRCLLVVLFLCRYHTLAPEPAEETYVEISDTEPEDPAGAPSTTYPGKGETYNIPYSFQLACLAVVQNECLILPTLHFASIKTQTAMIPTS